jgi:hypothetical protein
MNRLMFSVLGACVAMTACAADSGDDDEAVGSDEAAVVTPWGVAEKLKTFDIGLWLDNAASRARTQCRATLDENGKASGPYGLIGFHVDVANQAVVNVEVASPHAGTAIGRCIEQSIRLAPVPKNAPAFGRDKHFTIDKPGKG